MTAKRTREPETAPAPDPVIELAERWQREMTLWLEKTETSAAAIEADADSLKALEDELEAATPTTREGLATLLDVARRAFDLDIPSLGDKLIENARDAVRGGVS